MLYYNALVASSTYKSYYARHGQPYWPFPRPSTASLGESSRFIPFISSARDIIIVPPGETLVIMENRTFGDAVETTSVPLVYPLSVPYTRYQAPTATFATDLATASPDISYAGTPKRQLGTPVGNCFVANIASQLGTPGTFSINCTGTGLSANYRNSFNTLYSTVGGHIKVQVDTSWGGGGLVSSMEHGAREFVYGEKSDESQWQASLSTPSAMVEYRFYGADGSLDVPRDRKSVV